MAKSIQEYLAYTNENNGLLVPIVAVLKADGPITYRDFLREDLQRIPETFVIPGGWFFKRNHNSQISWTRRFGILRGKYVFLFHSPLNEKPISVIPLNGADIATPDDGLRSFDQKSAQSNEGYEWEIRGIDGLISRIYSLSSGERDQWVQACVERSHRREESAPMQLLLGQRIPSRAGSNVIVTTTKLEGESPADMAASEGRSQYSASNPYYPPPPPPDEEYFQPTSGYASQSNSNNFQENMNYYHQTPPPPPPPYSPDVSGSGSSSIANIQTLAHTQTPSFSNYQQYGSNDQDHEQWEDARSVGSGNNDSVSLGRAHPVDNFERAMLDMGIQSVRKVQDDAKKRETAIREQTNSKKSQKLAQDTESANPMTLAEMLRCMLLFMHEILCEDPLPNLPLQIPYLKGEYAEGMVTTVYQYYCNHDTGYLTLEGFVSFMDDLAILKTHVPHDESDSPSQQFEALLDPVRLLTTIPRTLGTSLQMQKDSMLRRKSMVAATSIATEQDDGLSVNFTQFYQLLLKITQIVYKELYEADMTVALNNFLLESLCPLMAWCKGHCKRGSHDILVTEERIPLLLLTYSPNLWKVFLMYAHNSIKKAPDETALKYPEFAKQNEKALFGVSPGAPNRGSANKDYLVISESSFLRLCSEYALCPQLCSIKECKEIFNYCNRAKNITKLVNRDMQAPTAASQLTRAAKGKTTTIFKQRRPSSAPMYFGKAEENRIASPPPAPGPGHTEPVPLPPVQLATGLGFSEFIEALSRVAVEGMQQENYNILFPTPFSKIIALLTTWGLADLKKLEDVKAIHTIAVDIIN